MKAVAFAWFIAVTSAVFALPSFAQSVPASSKAIELRGKAVVVHYHRDSGLMDISWNDGHSITGLASGAVLEDGKTVSSTAYSSHVLDAGQKTSTVPGTRVYAVKSTAPGLPNLIQRIWVYDKVSAIAVQAELQAKTGSVGTRHFDAVVLKGSGSLRIEGKDLRILHVPFDNDMWFRYNSVAVAEMKPGQLFSGNEATAIYDNTTRQALLLGSIVHDKWKTAIEAHAADGELTDLDIYGGITSPTGVRTDTHDTVPHGIVRGAHVTSPRIFIGSFADWREGLEAYGEANAAIQPPLKWASGAPIGWNSWAAYADKISDKRYLDTAAFVRDKLVPEGFGDNRVVYVNLDAFWWKLDPIQLAESVSIIRGMKNAQGMHFEPGIYWAPFVYHLDDLDAYVEGTGMKYRYRDIILKAPDGSMMPKVDGLWPVDPTHPGAKARIKYFFEQMHRLDFNYIKIDFLAHGALEGAHYDPAIQTGIEAYNAGMKQVVAEAGPKMFLSLSIAPLFPSGYGHARRLACDTKGHIAGREQSTEYMLNSLTYGWWSSKNLYITDPDHVVLGSKADLGARTVDEGKSRLLSTVISGGMILDSSQLADDPEGQALAKDVYNNRAWMKIAAEGKTFLPVEGNTGDQGANVFYRPTLHGAYVAIFNFDEKKKQKVSVSLARIDEKLAPAGSVSVVDVASGTALEPAKGELSVSLEPAASTLLELRWK
ncbi:alpha-galactosidase [Granulicella aggregans]|uniref:hypothetical protein n=1 Tax=Granulicella aggregans TaxID=474949 RepID=UPI0021E00F93|nr:hypothetical protein [Granulicella aggregans]